MEYKETQTQRSNNNRYLGHDLGDEGVADIESLGNDTEGKILVGHDT